MPNTSKRLDNILPIKDVCTISTSSFARAIIDTISSTAFLSLPQLDDPGLMRLFTYPNVAFNNPPSVSPTRNAISSVA